MRKREGGLIAIPYFSELVNDKSIFTFNSALQLECFSARFIHKSVFHKNVERFEQNPCGQRCEIRPKAMASWYNLYKRPTLCSMIFSHLSSTFL